MKDFASVWVSRLASARWLEPDYELSTQAPSALSWIEERLDEIHASLAYFEPEVPLIDVRYDSDPARIAEAWGQEWSDALKEKPSEACKFLAALFTAAQWKMNDVPKEQRTQFDRAIARTRIESRAASRSWGCAFGLDEAAPGEALMFRGFCADHVWPEEARENNLWVTLFQLYARGVWPVAMPFGRWFVWIPPMNNGVALLSSEESRQQKPVLTPSLRALHYPGHEKLWERTKRLGVPPCIGFKGQTFLRIVDGPFNGSFSFSCPRGTIGNDVGAAWPLLHRSVAPKHLRIEFPSWTNPVPFNCQPNVNRSKVLLDGLALNGITNVNAGNRLTVGDFVLEVQSPM